MHFTCSENEETNMLDAENRRDLLFESNERVAHVVVDEALHLK